MKIHYFKGDAGTSDNCNCGKAQKLPGESGCLECMLHVLPRLVKNAEAKLISWNRPQELSKKIISVGEKELNKAREESNFNALIINVSQELASI